MKMNSAYRGEIIKDIIFTLLTCGIYGLFWQNRLFKAVNEASARDDEGCGLIEHPRRGDVGDCVDGGEVARARLQTWNNLGLTESRKC
jgi:hypothetical protein